MQRAAIGLALSYAATFVAPASVFAQDTVAPATSIRIAIGPITPPLFFIDLDGQLRGFVPDLLRETAARAKLDLAFEVVPDETSLRALKPADVPLVVWLKSEIEPDGYNAYSFSYLKLGYAVFRRKGPLFTGAFRASQLGEVLVLDDSEAKEDLSDIGVSPFPVPTLEEAFKRLAAGEHDTVAADEYVARQVLSEMRLPSITAVSAPDILRSHNFKFLGARGQPFLETLLRPALDSMRHDGSYDALYDRWLTPLEPKFVSENVYKSTIAAAAAIALALVLTGFVFRRRLIRAIRRKDSQLYESVSRLDEIVGGVEAVVWESTLDGRFTYVSPYAETLFGYPMAQWKRPDFWETVLLHPEDREEAVQAISTAAARGKDHRMVYRVRRANGDTLWIKNVVKVVKDPDGKPLNLRGVIIDITDRKQAEETVQAERARLAAIMEASPTGIFRLDLEGRVTFGNQEALRITSFDSGPIDLRRWLNAVHRDDRAAVASAWKALAGTEGADEREFRFVHPDGKTVWVLDRGVSERDASGRVTGFVGTLTDITEAKRMQEALRESEEKFRLVAENAPVGIAVFDGKDYTYANGESIRLLGYAPGDLAHLDREGRGARLFAGDGQERFFAALKHLDAAENMDVPAVLDDVCMRHRDGTPRWVSLMISRLVPGRRYPVLIITVDMTARRHLDRQLREERNFTSAVLQNAGALVVVLDREGRIRRFNRAAERLSGRTFAEIEGKYPWETFLPKEDAEAIRREAFEEPTRNPTAEAGSYTNYWASKSGERRLIEWSNTLLLDDHGKTEFMVSVGVDITERKRAEDALRQSEARLALIFDSTSDLQVLFRVEDSGRYIIEAANRAYTHFLRRAFPQISLDLVGRERAEYLALLGFSGEGIATERPMFRRAAEQRDTVSYTIPFAVNGAEVSFEVSVEPVLDPEGRCTHLLWSARDVTARKRAEAALEENRRALRVLMSNLPGMAYRCRNDHNWTLEFASEGCLPLTGFTVDELVTRALVTYGADIVHPEDQEAVWAAVQAGLNEKRPFELVYRIRTKSAEQKWVWEQGRGIYAPTGELLALEGFVVDITARIRAEEASRLSEERLKEAQRLAKIGSWELDLATNDLVWSDEIYRIFEIDKSQFGASYDAFLDAVHPEDREAVDRAYTTSLATKQPYVIEHRLLMPDGRVKWVCEQCNTIYDEDGRPLRSTGTVQDITERITAEEERRSMELNMQQVQRLESLGVLAGGIAHDFNNLLAGVLGNAELAMEDASAVRESLGQIKVAALRASDLVRQMLAYAGKGRMETQRVHLGKLVREMTELLSVTLSKKAVLDFQVDDGAPCIAADAAQIQQVVMNFITNASDALGDEPGTIRLKTGVAMYDEEALKAFAPHQPAASGRFVYFEVSDTGCGMDAATLDRIFEPFFTTKFTGRGLGLAATLGIIRSHQGGLRVESLPGRGTTFHVIFPAVSGAAVAEAGSGQAIPRARARAGTLLVVDDEARVRDFLVRALERFGHEVLVAADGRQALEVFERHRARIGAVVLDVTMPEMSGNEVMRALHAREPDLPVLLMSGYTEAEARGVIDDGACAGFLQKPFSIETLRAAVNALLAGK